jgi:hypothetical protein
MFIPSLVFPLLLLLLLKGEIVFTFLHVIRKEGRFDVGAGICFLIG